MFFIYLTIIFIALVYICSFLDRFKLCSATIADYQNNKTKQGFLKNITFFRYPEPFVNEKDAKEMSLKNSSLNFDNDLHKNAEKQWIVQKNFMTSKIKDKLYSVRRDFFQNNSNRWSVVDVVTICFYMIVPVLFSAFLHHNLLNLGTEFYDDIIKGIVFEHRIELFTAQLSLTFITISVMSVFTDGDSIIYWQNVVKKTLITPPARCFKAYFWYSFIYLFSTTIAIILKKPCIIAVLFIFNIICLFDLSRVMINCYYGQTKKKQKIVNQFIKDIEKANKVYFSEGMKQNYQTKYVENVLMTLEDFNCNINEAYTNRKYVTVKEDLAVYGRLLARMNSAAIVIDDSTILEWLDEKTLNAYYALVYNYYKEYHYLALGYSHSKTSNLSNGRETIIDKALMFLIANTHSTHENNKLYDLLLYRFYTYFLMTARQMDIENFHKYTKLINIFSEKQSLLDQKEKFGNLLTIFYKSLPDSDLENYNLFFFKLALEKLIISVIVLNSSYSSELEFSWIPWEYIIKDREEFTKKLYKELLAILEAYPELNEENSNKRFEQFCEKNL